MFVVPAISDSLPKFFLVLACHLTRFFSIPLSTRFLEPGDLTPDVPLGVAGEMQDFCCEPVGGEIESSVDIKIGLECCEFARFRDARDDLEKQRHAVGLGLAVPAHVPALDHARVVLVHGDFCPVLLPEVSGVVSMVGIAVGQNDKLQVSGLAPRAGKFFFEFGALAFKPGVDQDATAFGFDQVAIHTPQIDRF